MTKSELQKALSKLERQYENLSNEHVAQREELATVTARYSFYKNQRETDQECITRYAIEIENLKDSEHALRCIRMPHLELQVDDLEKQRQKATEEYVRKETEYREVLGTLKTLIQNQQRERVCVSWT